MARQPIARLLDVSRIELTIDVPESTISNARYVTGIEVTFDAFRGRPVPATIKEIGREASERTRTYPVTLIMDQPDDITILPGMAGTVRGTVELPSDQDVFEVPMSALLSDESDKTYVWLIEGESEIKRARRMEVEVAGLSARGARVRGLSPGQLVATAGAASLKQEQQVRVFDESAISAGARRRGGS